MKTKITRLIHQRTLGILATILILTVNPFAVSKVFGQALQLNGIALHSELRRDYYIGALYVSVPTTDSGQLVNSEQHKRMVMKTIAKRWSSRAFEQHWTQSILINNSEDELSAHSENVLRFTSLVKSKLIAGDEVFIDNPLGEPLTISVNGTRVMSVADDGAGFFRLLLRGWVGARPPSSDFKRDIVKRPADAAELQAIYDGVQADQARIDAVAQWAEPLSEGGSVVEVASGADQEAAANAEIAAQEEAARLAAEREAAAKAAADREAAELAAAEKAAAEAAALAAAQAEEERKARELAEQVAGMKLLYRSNVMKKIYSKVRYPDRAIDRGQEGTVELQVTLSPDGKVASSSIVTESEHSLLNKAATKALKSAKPFSAPPELMGSGNIDLLIPIRFQIPK